MTPEVVAALRASFEEMSADFERVQANIEAARARAKAATGSAKSADGGIRVTVGASGNLTGLEIDPRAYRESSPSELAKTILSLAERAAADAKEQTASAFAPLLPGGVSLSEMVDGNAPADGWGIWGGSEERLKSWWATLAGPVADGKPPAPSGRSAKRGK